MISVEPAKFAKMDANALDESGYLGIQKARIEFLRANSKRGPTRAQFQEAAELIGEETEIHLSADQMREVLAPFPEASANLADTGTGDTATNELIFGAFASYVAGTRWPDFRDNVDMDAFLSNLKIAARFMGFSVQDDA